MRFILNDSVLEIEIGRRILATKTVSQMDDYLSDHYVRRPILPASMLLECLAQTAGWLVQCGHGFDLYLVIVIVEGLQLHRPVRPGETLLVEAFLDHAHRHGATMHATARIGDETVATVERLVFAHEVSADPDFPRRRRELFEYVSSGAALLGDGVLDDGVLDDGVLDDGVLDDGVLDDGVLENGGEREP